MEPEKVDITAERYGNIPHNYNYSALSSGHKLSTSEGTSPSWGQRLALALGSLILWMIVFFVVILIITTTPAQIITPTGPIDNSKGLYTITFLLSLGLLIFSAIVLAINILFNRRH